MQDLTHTNTASADAHPAPTNNEPQAILANSPPPPPTFQPVNPPAPIPSRTWDPLPTLTLDEVSTLFLQLSSQHAATYAAYTTALSALKDQIDTFLQPTSSPSTIISNLRAAQAAASALFPAQTACRSALATLAFLVTDLIDVLPAAQRGGMRAEYEAGMKACRAVEAAVRQSFWIWGPDPRMSVKEKLKMNLACGEMREGNWKREGEDLEGWGKGCLLILGGE